MRRILSLVLCFFSITTFAANEINCDKGFEAIAKIKNSSKPWFDFSEYFKKYVPNCDDGYYAEGTGDLTVTLLADWKDFPGLDQSSKNNKPFLEYVLKNINSTADRKYLGLIMENAKSKCPKENTKLCKQIGKAAAKAVKDMSNEL